MNKKAVSFVVICALSAVCLSACSSQPAKKADFSGVQSVCELATLQCFFHNVAESDVPADDDIWGYLFNKGHKKAWIEYDGIVTVGVDVGEVTIGEPNAENVVLVHVPDAKILSVNANKYSIAEVSESGWITDVSIEEKTEMYAAAQEDMKAKASENSSILLQAHERAKRTIEAYVTSVGEELGQSYTVQWV